ncbi:MAG: fibronectin type III domain-containing protein, partial [Cyclobacteriaceae bacterium]
MKANIILSSLLIGVLLSLAGLPALAQCPTPGGTSIVKTDELCFNADDGTVTFTFSDGVYPSAFDYRVRVWNFDLGTYVYDDNNPPFLNQIPAPSIVADVLIFSNVPPGDYILVLDGGSCVNQSYGVNYSGAPNNGIRVNAANEIIIDAASITTTGNDQCVAPYNGSIDATGAVSGGTGSFEYSIDGGSNYQTSPIFNNIEHGTYTLRVRDSNECVLDQTDIVVDDNRVSPTAAISPDPASVCAGENLLLNGNPSGGAGSYTHQWTGDVSLLSATNVADPTFNAPDSGTYALTYTVTDANGCTASSAISVTVNALPVVANQTPEVCADMPGGTQATGVNLTANNAAIDGGNGYTINWYADAGPATPIADPTNVTVNDGDDFYAEVMDGNGCSAVATVIYSVISAPLAPANLATANVVCGGFDISWDAAATATSYRIEVDEDAGFGSPEVNVTQAGTSYSATGLMRGTNYNIRITPINSCGDGTAGTGTETTTDVPD